jgi:probable phosphoglycerate mutase
MGDDTELVLVRHGEGGCNAAGVIGGDAGCTGLTALGREQSGELVERLAAMHAQRRFDVLLASPRLRVRQSAEIVAAALGLSVVVVHDLRGQDFGTADGAAWEAVTRAFGGPPTRHPTRPIAPGAEPWASYADRVLGALRRALAEYRGRRILLIAHGKTTGLAGALLAGEPDPAGAVAGYVIGHGELAHWHAIDGIGPDGFGMFCRGACAGLPVT